MDRHNTKVPRQSVRRPDYSIRRERSSTKSDVINREMRNAASLGCLAPRSGSADIERTCATGHDQSPGQYWGKTETRGSGDNPAGALASNQGFGDDAADSRGHLLGGVRGAHSKPALSSVLGLSRPTPVPPPKCETISVSTRPSAFDRIGLTPILQYPFQIMRDIGAILGRVLQRQGAYL